MASINGNIKRKPAENIINSEITIDGHNKIYFSEKDLSSVYIRYLINKTIPMRQKYMFK